MDAAPGNHIASVILEVDIWRQTSVQFSKGSLIWAIEQRPPEDFRPSRISQEIGIGSTRVHCDADNTVFVPIPTGEFSRQKPAANLRILVVAGVILGGIAQFRHDDAIER